MTRDTVRLTDLASITNRTRDTIRNLQNQKHAPWDDSAFPEGQYRRYTAAHALALVLAEMLVSQGVTPKFASDFVRTQHNNVHRFLKEVDAGKGVTQRFVTAMFVAEDDNWTGPQWTPYIFIGTGTSEEIIDAFASALKQTGTVHSSRGGKSETRRIGGPHMSVAPIDEAYRLLKMRAEVAGFMVDGFRILPINRQETDEDSASK